MANIKSAILITLHNTCYYSRLYPLSLSLSLSLSPSQGIELLHLSSGHPLFSLPLSFTHTVHGDINADGVMEHVNAVINSGEGKRERGGRKNKGERKRLQGNLCLCVHLLYIPVPATVSCG